MREQPSLAKLYRILISTDWKQGFQCISKHTLSTRIRSPADWLENMRSKEKHHKKFSFERMWLVADDIQEIVQRSWNQPINESNTAGVMMRKLARLRKELKKWEKTNFGHVLYNKREINKNIEELEFLEKEEIITPEQMAELQILRGKIEEIYEWQEIIWCQHSGILWLKEDD